MSCLTFIRLALAAAAVAAVADPVAAQVTAPVVGSVGVEVTAPRPLLFAARRSGDKALSQQRGGTDLASDTSLRGVVSDNQAGGNTTGSNLITGGSLAGASGVPVVVQNTGNNVLIQSATIVNVQLK